MWKIAGGGAVPASDELETFVTEPHLEDPSQLGTAGMDRSVYLSVCRRDSGFCPKANYPLYKVDVAAAGSSNSQKVHRFSTLNTGAGKIFISLPSGWIIGVGGESSDTIIVDIKTPTLEPKVIRGPNLLATKWHPVVVAVGPKVYALARSARYKTLPDSMPLFEVLDLSKGTVTAKADGSLSMDGCFWEALSCPPFFPSEISPLDYEMPPVRAVRSYVVIRSYILISLNHIRSCTLVFDTILGVWHNIDDIDLPFYGPATPHGPSDCIFLGSCLDTGFINAYCIQISTSRLSSAVATPFCGSPLKLSVTELPIKDELHDNVGSLEEQYIISLDSQRFCLLSFRLDQRKRSLSSYSSTSEIFGTYSRKLFAKLTTYKIENPVLLEEAQDQEDLAAEPEVVISTLSEQDFKFSSYYGFTYPQASLALSI